MKRPFELARLLVRLWPHVRPWRRTLVAALFGAACGALVPLATPLLLRWLFDNVILRPEVGISWRLDGLFSGCVVLVTLELISGVADYVQTQGTRTLGVRLGHSLRTELYERLIRLDRATRESVAEGQFLSRLHDDVGTVEQVFSAGIHSLVLAPFSFLAMAGILFWLDWKLATVACLPLPLLGVTTLVLVWRQRRLAPIYKDRAAELFALATERLGAITLIQLHARESTEARRYRETSEAAARARLDLERVSGIAFPLLSFIAFMGIVLVIYLGGYDVVHGRGLSPGTLVAFVAYLAWFYAPLAEISRANFYLQNAAIACERIFTWTDRVPAIVEPSDAPPLGQVTGAVSLEGVTFRYAGASKDALTGVLLRLEPGERVAILGASGSGKSTLLRLMVRLDDPAVGIVKIDGRDVRSMRLDDLRRAVALVPQEDLCLNESFAANISLGVPESSSEAIARAAALAGVDAIAARHPHGLSATIGERGVRLSGGERQRVCLARAILRAPAVLLLDEPTAALDVASEQAILAALFAALPRTTIVFVSHRPSIQSQVGRVIRMEEGRVVEDRAMGREDRS